MTNILLTGLLLLSLNNNEKELKKVLISLFRKRKKQQSTSGSCAEECTSEDRNDRDDMAFHTDDNIERPGKLDHPNHERNSIQRKFKSERSDPKRKRPDQGLIHKYANMIRESGQTNCINALDHQLKKRILKFVQNEKELIDFCLKHKFPYEEPNEESDYSRRQRVRSRIMYHLKKKQKH